MRPQDDHHTQKLQAVAASAMEGSQRWAEPFVARLATEIWRLNRRLEHADDAGQLKGIRDSVRRIDDIFAEHEVQAVDHDGEQYDPGHQVEVLHQREGSGRLVVLETIRPTVTLAGRILQHGQVVIGPDDLSAAEAHP